MRKSILSPEQQEDDLNKNHTYYNNGYFSPSGYSATPNHGVNVVLAGAMLSGIILIMFILCYCCHKSDRKSDNHLSNYGRYPDLPLEVFTVGSAETGLDSEALTNDTDGPEIVSPPPAYEIVISSEKARSPSKEGLPTYEYAIQHLDGPWR